MDDSPTCCRITLPERLESLPALSDFVADACQTLGIDAESAYTVQLAVEEACANLIQHGGSSSQPDPPGIAVDLCRDGQHCTVTLRDRGKPFDPTSLPPPDLSPRLRKRRPGGLGVYLIRRLMDQVSYSAEDGVNTLTMVKRLP
jgi:anti-sigma regulatory factor (Ser/Thr protein kinase)